MTTFSAGGAPASPPPPRLSPTLRSELSISPPSRPLPRVMAVANQKGGVGKTTTTVNLGACLAELGLPDADRRPRSAGQRVDRARDRQPRPRDVDVRRDHARGAAGGLHRAAAVKNLFVAPASLDLAGAEIELVPAFSRENRLRRASRRCVDDYDYVLIDCPPSLGLLTVNGLAAANEVLVPIQCEYYALEGLGQLLRNVDLVRAQPQPDARGQHHRLRDVRRPHQAGRSGRARGARALRRQGLPHGHPAHGPALRGAVVRAADHHLRSVVAGRRGVPRAGQGGQPWRASADSVRGSGR